jgi:PAS domain S-box-containing protein
MRLTSAKDLTDSEIRVIPWLPMFLSFAAIGERVGLSAATVKAVAIGLYRRLDVASRSEAVERCVELGVLAAVPASSGSPAAPPPADEDVRPCLESLDEAFFRMTAVRDATGRIVDFRYHYCNRAALEVLGRPRAQVIGRSLLELFPSHLTDGLFDAYVEVVESGVPLRYEFTFNEAGVVGEFEVLVSSHGDGYVLSGHDISDRKRRERNLVLVNDQLQEALTSRVVIEQAKGYAAALSGTDPETAYQVIRRHARDNHRRIGEVARSVVSGEIDLREKRKGTG